MIREKRYVVIKRTDLFRALTKREIEQLERLCLKVAGFRRAAKKKPLMCVVVESDWPEYEPTWQAIEKRVEAETSGLRRLGLSSYR